MGAQDLGDHGNARSVRVDVGGAAARGDDAELAVARRGRRVYEGELPGLVHEIGVVGDLPRRQERLRGAWYRNGAAELVVGVLGGGVQQHAVEDNRAAVGGAQRVDRVAAALHLPGEVKLLRAGRSGLRGELPVPAGRPGASVNQRGRRAARTLVDDGRLGGTDRVGLDQDALIAWSHGGRVAFRIARDG